MRVRSVMGRTVSGGPGACPASSVVDDPGDALVAAVAEVDHEGDQHRLEGPGDVAGGGLGEDGPAGRAGSGLVELLVLDDAVALLAPRHGQRPPRRTRSLMGVGPRSKRSRSWFSM